MTKQQQIDALKADLELYTDGYTTKEKENIELHARLKASVEMMSAIKHKLKNQKLALDALYRAIVLIAETGKHTL